MGKVNAGSRRHAGDERLPDHQFQLDAGRPAGIDPAATQFGQLRRLWQFGRVFVTVGRQQWWRWRGRPRLDHGIRVEFQLSQSVGPGRWQCRDDRRCLRQCRLDWLPGAGLPGRTVARFGRFCATPATGLAVAAGAGRQVARFGHPAGLGFHPGFGHPAGFWLDTGFRFDPGFGHPAGLGQQPGFWLGPGFGYQPGLGFQSGFGHPARIWCPGVRVRRRFRPQCVDRRFDPGSWRRRRGWSWRRPEHD